MNRKEREAILDEFINCNTHFEKGQLEAIEQILTAHEGERYQIAKEVMQEMSRDGWSGWAGMKKVFDWLNDKLPAPPKDTILPSGRKLSDLEPTPKEGE